MRVGQQYATTGFRRPPLSLGASIREQASRLPALYAQKQQEQYQEDTLGLKREELGLQREAQTQARKQWAEEKEMQREAADVAKGGMMLQGGMGTLKLMAGKGMFDSAGDSVGGLFKGAEPVSDVSRIRPQAYGENQPLVGPNYTFVGDESYSGAGGSQQSQTSSDRRWYEGEGGWSSGWQSGVAGGVGGGMLGAGGAKTLGAKKKWQTSAAGAGGGMLASWLSGADSPFSIALGGMIGGGLGALL